MLSLKIYRKKEDDSLYLDFAPAANDAGDIIDNHFDVVVRAADGAELGCLCTITPHGVIRRLITESDDAVCDSFTMNGNGYYPDLTAEQTTLF